MLKKKNTHYDEKNNMTAFFHHIIYQDFNMIIPDSI